MMPLNLSHPSSKSRSLPLTLVVLASCSWANVTFAQEPASGDPAAAPVVPAEPVPSVPTPGEAKTPAKPAAETPVESPAPNEEKRKNPFRTGESKNDEDGVARSSAGRIGTRGVSSKRKSNSIAIPDADEAPEKSASGSTDREATTGQLVVPGFYGRGPLVVTPGRGAFARPKFRYGISAGLGYDDNPDQVSSGSLSTVAKPRKPTGFTWVNGHWDAQWLKPSSAFTLNAEAGANFYWNRPGNSSDYNARVGMLYVKQFNPRTQISANASLAYLSQPDYSNYYASTSLVGGDYFTASTKFDLTHRWAPHFSTVTSASFNVLKYANESPSGLTNSYWNFTIGNEFRFQTSSRYAWVVEGRYGFDQYFDNSALNSETAYVLGGLDWIASRYLTASFRAGASFRSYDRGGDASAPYGEVSLNYRTGRHSTLTMNARYGFEQSNSVGDNNLAYRLGLSYQHAFTSRLSGNVGFNYIHTDYNPLIGADSSTDLYDLSAGLQYRFDRHFSLAARYAYTLQDTSNSTADYDRNRFLFSIQYEF